MNISIIGTGYVGLVTGTCLAECGNLVSCVDIDRNKVQKLKSGQITIYEPDLENLFQRNISEGRLSFTSDLREGVKNSDVIFLCLPTPAFVDGSADLSYIFEVADKLGDILNHYTVIVDKSTVPVGTSDQVKQHISKHAKVDFDVVSNPEFLREGFAVTDFMKPDRIIIGTSSIRAQKVMEILYKPFVRQGNPILVMSERSAEMTKYAANSFLATKISFMNEIANLSELTGADVDSVRLGIGADDRIGKRFLFSGIGFGGSCFPKDVAALHKTALDHNYDFKILEAVSSVNSSQKLRLMNKLKKYFGENLSGKKFALWGLSFKPNTDDIREAPALDIIENLLLSGASVVAYDPVAIKNVLAQFGEQKGLSFADNEYNALDGADALIIATEWSEFHNPDFKKVKKLLKQPVIFDGRNIFDLEAMKQEGFHYESIGRSTIKI